MDEMAIPDYQTLMRPILECLADGEEHVLRELIDTLSNQFQLTDEERMLRIPSNQQTYISNRVSWARSHMRAAGLIENPRRGIARLTELGRQQLSLAPQRITASYLRQFPSYLEFIGAGSSVTEGVTEDSIRAIIATDQTPQELIDKAYLTLKQAMIEELLEKLKACSPQFFEQVVVQLLLAMGYGGSSGRGFTTRYRSDSGVDGVIEQDKLGLEKIVVQAKRWEATVGRPAVQGFVGSMFSYAADKGVIISTSNFSRDAIDFATNLTGKKLVLIDGQRLTELMIDHNLGVSVKKTYELKEVSNDFFEED